MSRFTLTLCAQPNADFASTSHRGSVSIPAQEVQVSGIGEAVRLFAAFISEHDLHVGNLGGEAGLVRRDGLPLCKISVNGRLWEVDEIGRETGRQYVRPRFAHIGQIVRFLRQAADLTRNEMADATGIATSTIRNLETGRHLASAWTWQRLLAHPCLADLPRFAAESGLAMPPGTKGGTGANGGGAGGSSGGEPGGSGDGGGPGSGGGR